MKPVGETDLIGERGVRKSDLRIGLIGAIDEASSALSMAKGFCSPDSQVLLDGCQKDLSNMMGVLAALPRTSAESLVDCFSSELANLEETIRVMEAATVYPGEFIRPGQTPATGTLDLARAIVRRVEREAVAAFDALQIPDRSMLQYLNRLSTICYLLILAEMPA